MLRLRDYRPDGGDNRGGDELKRFDNRMRSMLPLQNYRLDSEAGKRGSMCEKYGKNEKCMLPLRKCRLDSAAGKRANRYIASASRRLQRKKYRQYSAVGKVGSKCGN